MIIFIGCCRSRCLVVVVAAACCVVDRCGIVDVVVAASHATVVRARSEETLHENNNLYS